MTKKVSAKDQFPIEYEAWIWMRQQMKSGSGRLKRGAKLEGICERLNTSSGFIEHLGRKPDGEYALDHNDESFFHCGNCTECIKNSWTNNTKWSSLSELARRRVDRGASLVKDYAGQTINGIYFIRLSPNQKKYDENGNYVKVEGALWIAKCPYFGVNSGCVGEFEVYANRVVAGNTTSCGCNHYKHMQGNKIAEIHGRWKTSEWRSWDSMMARCLRPESCAAYSHYGARGIIVCTRWRVFANFIADLGPMPTDRGKMSIDRFPDNQGNYSCGKCDDCLNQGRQLNARWATYKEQANNRRYRGRRRLTHPMTRETMSLSNWAKRLGIAEGTLRDRLKAWSLHEALTIGKIRTAGPGARHRHIQEHGHDFTI